MNMDGMPKAKYNISDKVVDSVIKLQEDVELQKVTKEYKSVIQAIELVNEDSKFIFEEYYKKGKGKWEIIDTMGISEETYKRRRKDLIYTVNKELKKI